MSKECVLTANKNLSRYENLYICGDKYEKVFLTLNGKEIDIKLSLEVLDIIVNNANKLGGIKGNIRSGKNEFLISLKDLTETDFDKLQKFLRERE